MSTLKLSRARRLRRTSLAATAVLAAILIVQLGAGPSSGASTLEGPTGVHHLVTGIHYCDGCTPPLTYSGGPVMTTNTSSGLTITPIYWVPSGSALPSDYERILNTYVANVAAASNSATNVYSIDTEYYDVVHGVKSYVTYHYKAGSPIVDTDAYPANGCTPATGYTACITDAQIRTELQKVLSRAALPTTLADFYPMFFAENVETQDRDGTNSVSAFCGYHRAFAAASGEIVYANLPYEATGCDGGQAPNGDLAADGAVSTLSHELNEAVTDPTDKIAWNDSTGHEIGDICADAYGPALGSTSSSSPSTTEYNQLIDGGKYYMQEEFSNLAYSKQGVGAGCQQSEADAQHLSGNASGAVASIFSDAFPETLPADGTSTTKDRIVVADASGFGIANDHVSFSEYQYSGAGQCGSLNEYAGTTAADGTLTVTYTASNDSATCSIVATEADGGRSSESFIYQGADRSLAPTASAAFPTSLVAGAAPTEFTVTFKNPSGQALNAARVDVDFFTGAATSKSVKASEVTLTASTTGADGTFTPVALTGSTSSSGGHLGLRRTRGGLDDSGPRERGGHLQGGAEPRRPALRGDPPPRLRGLPRPGQLGVGIRRHARRHPRHQRHRRDRRTAGLAHLVVRRRRRAPPAPHRAARRSGPAPARPPSNARCGERVAGARHFVRSARRSRSTFDVRHSTDEAHDHRVRE